MNETCTVYYEDWQLQCCGIPFSVGDDVEWTAIDKHKKHPKLSILIDYVEEHHGEDTLRISGHIDAIYEELSKDPAEEVVQNYDKAKVFLHPINIATGWNYPHGYSLWGYVVKLSHVSLSYISAA